MAATSSDKGKKPMEADPIGSSQKTTRKGKQNPTFGSDSEGTPLPPDSGSNVSQKSLEKQMRKARIDEQMLREIQADVQENISTLNNTSLFATVIGKSIEAKEIRRKIKVDWKFLSAGFQLFPLANNWFELKFDLKEDKDKVWEGRPFHVFGQLLLFRPWSLAFNPVTESVMNLDMWVRFPGLPIKYVSDSLLKAIVERNKIGSVIRVAAFNPNGARLRYPRVCVNADLTKIPNKRVLVTNERGELESYPIWFEDFPEGCGSCGCPDHVFENCPGRRVCTAEGGGVLGAAPEDVHMAEGNAGQSSDGGEWVNVAKKSKPIPPPSFGRSKEELWKSFGKNVDLSSDSSSDDSSATSGENSNVSIIDSIVVEPLPPVPEIEEYEPADEYQGDEEETPAVIHPNDANPIVVAAEFQDSEYYEADDEEMLDMDGDYEGGMVPSGIPADFTQEDFERLLGNIPASSEFNLPNLYNPDCLLPSSFAAFASPSAASPTLRFEQQGSDGHVKSESSKRKLGIEDDDTACSKLMGGGGKRGKNDE